MIRLKSEYIYSLRRRQLKLSRQAFAELAGVHQDTIQKIENNPDRKVEIPTAQKVAEGFTKAGRPHAWQDLAVEADLRELGLMPQAELGMLPQASTG